MPTKNKRKALKIRNSAKGEECQIRIPGICNHDESTTVACHLGGAGMGLKHSDVFIAYGCSSCHAAVDGQLKNAYPAWELKLMFYDGMVRTQYKLLKKGLITI